MKIIFCADPVNEEEADPLYIDEIASASRAGLTYALIDYEALHKDGNAARAVRQIPVQREVESAIYRGWTLRAREYALLYDALLSRGIRLINSAAQYRFCHHLPEALPTIRELAPQTVFMQSDGRNVSYDAIMQLLVPFAGMPVVMRDYVEAEKHHWYEACYISSASDATAVRNTVDRFLDLRGDAFEGGFVFREFIEFETIAEQPRERMPLIKEYRILYLHHAPIATFRYWDVDGYNNVDLPPLSTFDEIAHEMDSRFFTIDVAKRTDGDWMIIETGDGQVATLPKGSDLDSLYTALAGFA